MEALLLLASLIFALFYNRSLWALLFGAGGPAGASGYLLFAGLFITVVAVQFAGFLILIPRILLRPLLVVLFATTAFASFFMDRYGIFVNADMVRNVLKTDPAEARELLSLPLVLHLLLYAALPAGLVLWCRCRERPLRNSLIRRSTAVLGALVLAVAAVGLQFRPVASLVRQHRDARHLVTPTNYLVALYKVGRQTVAAPPGQRRAIGLDAHRVLPASTGRKPLILVLAIGETVRSANFGLSGYGRQTTPELAKLDLLVYPRVEACGTSTEVSLPCMLAPVGRRDYDEEKIRSEESLLHVLQRAGLDVLWTDNQSGCKGVCAGLPEEHLNGTADPAWCDGERCLDGILESRLARAVDGQRGDLVLVLHMLGNHGPAYSKRYPPEFRRFTPTCESAQLDDCTTAEIVNAYDNAVLYTDHVLASLIRYLAERTDREAALIYVSDHGESLGEDGLFLHGLPWRLAPTTQREVPMLTWLSPGFLVFEGLAADCLAAGTGAVVSHDNLFHSVLGLLRVETVIREPSLDLYSRCRAPATAASPQTAANRP